MNYKFPVSKPCLGRHEHMLVNEALRNCQLTHGEMTDHFERGLAEYLNVPFVVAVTSGTTALHLALAAAGVTRGHEVIVPDLTFVATANAVKYCGAEVVLADVDLETGCIDPTDVERKITKRTYAIVPVHLYGVPCDMENLKWPGIRLIEDAAEGFGGSLNGKMLGTLSAAGTFSFYGNKLLTTGEGGAVVTHNPIYADHMRLLRGTAHVPEIARYWHTEVGFNYRLTDLQAAVGLGQLKHLDQMVARRRVICALYRHRLDGRTQPWNHAPWLFTFLLPDGVDRTGVAAALAAKSIETRPTFVPLHKLPMYEDHYHLYPNANRWGSRGISLPTYPELELQDVSWICDQVLEAISDNG